MGGGLGRVSNHPEYYLSDGSVSFLTGNILFRVHKSFFERESEVFRNLFETAAVDDPQSGTDARPFTLDVKPDEFEQLLWVWYDREYSYQQPTKEQWVTILRLATRWEFLKIRELAIRQLVALDLPPAERISIYKEHGIDDERLLSSYVELCRSPTVPTKADGDLIEMETLINILQAREDAQRKAVELGHESPTSASLEDETLREIVSRFFGLDPRSTGSSTGSGAQASNLNGERHRGTSASTTITLGEPQVPDRNSDGKENREKVARDKAREEKVKEEKAREEKAKQEKEREEMAKVVKTAQEKEREEKEKRQKEKQAKEKEEREKRQRAGQNSYRT
ncbi:hypothetical protein OG21DRAFT_1470332 [Imleria badia]|nr:hypothetical protein OG21DRAFT_1470332 [Imleria badia]